MHLETLTRPVPVATTVPMLDGLVARIADGDRAAFRRVYAGLAGRTWAQAATAMTGHHGESPVVCATFVEVWYLARFFDRQQGGTRDWVSQICTRRSGDRLRLLAPAGDRHDRGDLSAHDRLVQAELVHLLGPGRSLVRLDTGVYARVSELDRALAVIAAYAGSTNGRSSGVAQPVS